MVDALMCASSSSGLESVVELHAIPGDLVLAPHHGAPEALLRVGHEAQGQLLRDQAFDQPLGIREVPLAAPGFAIRLRVGEMQRAREAWCTSARTAGEIEPTSGAVEAEQLCGPERV